MVDHHRRRRDECHRAVGSLTLVFSEKTLDRVTPSLVAFAAGSLIGGALFHMLPEAISEMGNELGVYIWFVGGFFTFFVLEQYLHWHHCHRTISNHDQHPMGYLILFADGLHNLIGGLAVGGSFLLDTRVGLIAWLVAAAHEVPRSWGTSTCSSTAVGSEEKRFSSTSYPP